jgi:hypothetical protein
MPLDSDNNVLKQLLELKNKQTARQDLQYLHYKMYALKAIAKPLFKDSSLTTYTLTEEGNSQAKQEKFDIKTYQYILLYLHYLPDLSTDFDKSRIFIDKILQLLETGLLSFDNLIEERNIARLAAMYTPAMQHEPLFCLNYQKDAEGKVIKTTFVHALFENNASKEDIFDYLLNIKFLVNGSSNEKMFISYLSCCDENGVSIIKLLKQKNETDEYFCIFNEVISYFRVFYDMNQTFEGVVTDTESIHIEEVDTHTESIHRSVDLSFINLAKHLFPKGSILFEGEHVVVQHSNYTLVEEIKNQLLKFRAEIENLLKEESSLDAFLAQTFGHKDDEGIKAIKKQEFIFQCNTVLRLLNKLDDGTRFDGFNINPNEPQSCGLTIKEMVALGYSCLKKRQDENGEEYWLNPGQATQQFIEYVNNLYIAMRGYNIDKYGPIEWQNHDTIHGNIPDINKCPGGFANQIAYGLINHKLVKIEIINSDILVAPLKQVLPQVLQYLSTEATCDELIYKWLQTNIMPICLSDKIIETINEKPQELAECLQEHMNFSATEIERYIPATLNMLRAAEFRKHFQPINVTSESLQYRKYDFVFDDTAGFVPFLEFHYKHDPNIVEEFLRNNIDSISESSKDVPLLNILCSANNFKNNFSSMVVALLSEKIKSMSRDHQESLFLNAAKIGCYNIMNICVEIVGSTICKAVSNYDECSAIHYACQSCYQTANQLYIMKYLLKYDVANDPDMKHDTPLMLATLSRNLAKIKFLIEHGAQIKGKNHDKTALSYAYHKYTRCGDLEIFKYLFNKRMEMETHIDEHMRNECNSLLILAAQKKDIEFFKFFLTYKIDIRSTIIHHDKFLKYLLSNNNANINLYLLKKVCLTGSYKCKNFIEILLDANITLNISKEKEILDMLRQSLTLDRDKLIESMREIEVMIADAPPAGDDRAQPTRQLRL